MEKVVSGCGRWPVSPILDDQGSLKRTESAHGDGSRRSHDEVPRSRLYFSRGRLSEMRDGAVKVQSLNQASEGSWSARMAT